MSTFSDKVQATYNRMADARSYRVKQAIKSGQPVNALIQRKSGLAVALYVLKPGGDEHQWLDYLDVIIPHEKVPATIAWVKKNYPSAVIDLKDY